MRKSTQICREASFELEKKEVRNKIFGRQVTSKRKKRDLREKYRLSIGMTLLNAKMAILEIARIVDLNSTAPEQVEKSHPQSAERSKKRKHKLLQKREQQKNGAYFNCTDRNSDGIIE
jgi:hypothetical protein